MYKAVIGLEVHCQLNTKTKNFSSSKNQYSSDPNTNVSTVDMGFPGILPIVNKEAVRKSIQMALAMHCTVPNVLTFDRKNYFYADLPKGYQITQAKKPIGTNGYVMIHVNGYDKKILIHDTHLEEDTASLDHYGTYTLIDYNRVGIPLLETVTEPCLSNSDEAVAFLEALRSIFLYCDASFARGDLGQIRCDVNVSLMKEGAKEFGTRTEMKNINSFSNVKLAIDSEIERQTKLLENGEVILQETRRYDEVTNQTYPMRSKVDAVDYKYYTEPNIPPILLTDEWISKIRNEVPVLQFDRIKQYMEDYELSRYDATILAKDKDIANYFEQAILDGMNAKEAANWITSSILSYINKLECSINDIFITPLMLKELVDLVNQKTISSKQAKEVLNKSLEEKLIPKEVVLKEGISQIGSDDVIDSLVAEVLSEHMEAIEQYQNGRTNIVDFLVGQVMKKSKGKANPAMTRSKMIERLEKR